MRRCPAAYCPNLIPQGTRACPEHLAQYEARRGSNVKRGYGTKHRSLRARWARKINAGGVRCARCGQPIKPGEPFDLGHNDSDRTRYNGPEHPHCNRSAGGRSAHPS